MKKTFFKINIYKPDLEKQKGPKVPIEERFFGFFAIMSFILIFFVVFYIFFFLYTPQKQRLEDARYETEDLNNRLNALKTIARDLSNKKEEYIRIRSEAVSWLDKMLAFSKALPENIWLSKFEFLGRSGQIKGGQDLSVFGYTFSGFREENLDQIGILLTRLNRSDAFNEDFNPLHLKYTKKSDNEWGITLFQYTSKSKDLTIETSAQ